MQRMLRISYEDTTRNRQRLGATALGKRIRQTICHSSTPEDEDNDEEDEEDGDDEEEELPWEMNMYSLFSVMTFPW